MQTTGHIQMSQYLFYYTSIVKAPSSDKRETQHAALRLS